MRVIRRISGFNRGAENVLSRPSSWRYSRLLSILAKGQEVKLADLVSEALERSPEILAAQKKYEAAKQRPSQAGSLPDPTLSMGWNSNGNPLPGAGLGRTPPAISASR